VPARGGRWVGLAGSPPPWGGAERWRRRPRAAPGWDDLWQTPPRGLPPTDRRRRGGRRTPDVRARWQCLPRLAARRSTASIEEAGHPRVGTIVAATPRVAPGFCAGFLRRPRGRLGWTAARACAVAQCAPASPSLPPSPPPPRPSTGARPRPPIDGRRCATTGGDRQGACPSAALLQRKRSTRADRGHSIHGIDAGADRVRARPPAPRPRASAPPDPQSRIHRAGAARTLRPAGCAETLSDPQTATMPGRGGAATPVTSPPAPAAPLGLPRQVQRPRRRRPRRAPPTRPQRSAAGRAAPLPTAADPPATRRRRRPPPRGGHGRPSTLSFPPHTPPLVVRCPGDQVYRCAISPFCNGGWRRASLSVRHFAIFLAIAPSPSPNLHRIARRIAKDTRFAKYVGQWHDGVTDVSCPPGLKLSTAPSLSDPMRGLDTLQGDLLCWRALLCPFKRDGPSKWVMGLNLWIWRRS